jgi:hypothetical protein
VTTILRVLILVTNSMSSLVSSAVVWWGFMLANLQ